MFHHFSRKRDYKKGTPLAEARGVIPLSSYLDLMALLDLTGPRSHLRCLVKRQVVGANQPEGSLAPPRSPRHHSAMRAAEAVGAHLVGGAHQVQSGVRGDTFMIAQIETVLFEGTQAGPVAHVHIHALELHQVVPRHGADAHVGVAGAALHQVAIAIVDRAAGPSHVRVHGQVLREVHIERHRRQPVAVAEVRQRQVAQGVHLDLDDAHVRPEAPSGAVDHLLLLTMLRGSDGRTRIGARQRWGAHEEHRSQQDGRLHVERTDWFYQTGMVRIWEYYINSLTLVKCVNVWC